MQAEADNAARSYPAYRTLWIWLLLGWIVSYADRTITGPVVTYMIENDIALLRGVENQFALGGLVGSMFFAGYMLTQFPGGYLGDRFGHRTIIVISIFWAAIATLVSGVMTALLGFVALRVITGLGEGTFYSNDRTVITQQSPYEKRSLGLGVVITGLSIGLTLALLLTPPLIRLGEPIFGADGAWRMPFFVLGAATVVVALGIQRFFKGQGGDFEFRPTYGSALKGLAGYSVVLFAAVMVVYVVSIQAGLPEWGTAILVTVLALFLIAFVFGSKGGEVSPILHNRNLILIYLAAIAYLWHLWFLGFWSVSIISDTGGTTFVTAGLTAAFNAGAGILGFPAGGWLADYAKRRGWGRKGMLASFTLILAVMTAGFGFYVAAGGQSLFVLSILLFVSSLFFFALQPISHALTADLVPTAALMGAAFGMWNLVAEIGAVLSPAVSGVLRGATGDWVAAVMVDAGIVFASFVLILFVRESGPQETSSAPEDSPNAASAQRQENTV
ncbi:MFS transporter [Rubrobacter aplysinae]|uniref:MFS transporter n=1 Tax=Rubrobacter aplysinae TaxID=909625 RepID=UPI00064BBB18|nr:MFS transporter [Rubrobacter aplysinae]